MKLDLIHSVTVNEPGFVEHNFYKGLGLTIRTHRRLKNFSQEYMATRLNISQNAYSKIEAGNANVLFID